LCSLSGGVLLSLGDLTDDSWVGGQGGVGLVERVGRCRHKLSTVVRAAITNDDLGGVLVGHNDGGAW